VIQTVLFFAQQTMMEATNQIASYNVLDLASAAKIPVMVVQAM
jgi:hypothetical protein